MLVVVKYFASIIAFIAVFNYVFSANAQTNLTKELQHTSDVKYKKFDLDANVSADKADRAFIKIIDISERKPVFIFSYSSNYQKDPVKRAKEAYEREVYEKVIARVLRVNGFDGVLLYVDTHVHGSLPVGQDVFETKTGKPVGKLKLSIGAYCNKMPFANVATIIKNPGQADSHSNSIANILGDGQIPAEFENFIYTRFSLLYAQASASLK